MFGGGGGRESRPQYVQNEWSLATEFIKDYIGAVCCVGFLTLTLRFPTMPLGLCHRAGLIRSQRRLMHAGRLQAHRFDSGVCGWHPNGHARYALLCAHLSRACWQATTYLHPASPPRTAAACASRCRAPNSAVPSHMCWIPQTEVSSKVGLVLQLSRNLGRHPSWLTRRWKRNTRKSTRGLCRGRTLARRSTW